MAKLVKWLLLPVVVFALPVGVGFELSGVSRYVDRGAALSEGAVLQPAVSFCFADFALTPWANLTLSGADGGFGLNEFDLTGEWSREVAGFNLLGMVGGYFYPGSEDKPELEVGAGVSRCFGNLELGVNSYFLTLPLPVGYYGELSGVFSREFSPCFSADIRASVGLGSGAFNEKNAGVNRWALSVIESELGLNWAAGGLVNVRPFARAVYLPDRQLREALEPGGWFFVAGLTIGKEF